MMDVLSHVQFKIMPITLHNNANYVQLIVNNVLIFHFVLNVYQIMMLIQLLISVN